MTSITESLLPEETASSPAVAVPRIEQPTTLSTDIIANATGALRNDVGVLVENVADLHGETLLIQLEARTDEAAKRSPLDLLEELADIGYSWTAIAHLVGVSIPALRKWRQGDTPTAENRRKLARLVAFSAVVTHDHLIDDVASWLEVPLAGTAYTGIDVWAAGHASDLLEYAAQAIDSGSLLDRFDGAWRTTIDDRFEIFEDEDGSRAIRLREEPATS